MKNMHELNLITFDGREITQHGFNFLNGKDWNEPILRLTLSRRKDPGEPRMKFEFFEGKLVVSRSKINFSGVSVNRVSMMYSSGEAKMCADHQNNTTLVAKLR